MLTGADVLHRRPVAGLPFVLVNNYGPSECTVVATSGIVGPDAEIGGPPSIGRPIRNTTALILDDDLRPVPDGRAGRTVPGRRAGRARLSQPARADGQPFRDLFARRTGRRCASIARATACGSLPNGEIAFLGRLDEQIKIRGYRIEPGEIVAWLDRYPGVEASAVIARVDAEVAAGAGADRLYRAGLRTPN